MSIWAEAHDLPHLDNAGKKIAYLPLLEYRFGRHADAFREEGSATLPSAYSRLPEIHTVDPDDHASDVGSIIHFYQRGVLGADDRPVPVGSFVVERRPDDLQSPAVGTTQLSGRGLTSYFLDRLRLLPFDHPKNPTGQSDWNFGAPEGGGMIRDSSFEGSGMPNGGFEDGNPGEWQVEEGSGGLQAIFDPGSAHSGNYYGLWNPAGSGSRLRRSIQHLTAGEVYTLSGRLDDLSGTGDRWRVGVSGARSASHTNAYFDDDEKIWWAELGNATQGNGSSTGAYQLTTLTFIAGESTVEIFWEYLDTNDHNAALDSWTIGGATVGIGAWNVSSNPGSLNVREISTDYAHSGAQSFHMQGQQPVFRDSFGRLSYNALRIWQDVDIIPGRIYSTTGWVYHEGPDPEWFVVRMSRTNPRGPLAQTISGGWLPAPGSYDMAAKYVLVEPDTWTPISITAFADTHQIRLSYAWSGMARPFADVGILSSPDFYFDDISFYEGMPAVNMGTVWNMMLQDRAAWLVPTFTASLDSNGDPWDAERSFSLSEGDTYGQIAESFQRLWGYVHRIRYDREDNKYYFDIFNGGYVAFDHSTTDTGTLTTGMNVLGGELVTRAPDATTFRVVGENGVFLESEDTALVDAWGDADFFLEVPKVGSADDLTGVLVEATARNRDQMVTFETEMGIESQVNPFQHFDIFHKVRVNMGESRPTQPGDRVVTSIVCSGKPGSRPSYQVFVNSDAFASTGAAALAEAVRRLLRKKAFLPKEQPGGITTGEGAGGVPRLVVAASDASPESQSKADIIIAGDDLQVFQAVASLFETYGGELRLTEGTYSPTGGEINFNNTWITGGGKGVSSISRSANLHFTGISGFRDLSFYSSCA